MKKTISLFMVPVFIFGWLSILLNSNSYFEVYLALALTALTFWYVFRDDIEWKPNVLTVCFSVLFACLILLANYNLYYEMPVPGGDRIAAEVYYTVWRLGLISTLLAGGFFVFCIILSGLRHIMRKYPFSRREYKYKPYQVFLCVFGVISFINLIILFLCYYPGIMTKDSSDQLTQILTGVYSNHHPYWHTQFIRLGITIGLRCFGTVNAAVCTYSVMSILCMAAIFAATVATIYGAGADKKIVIPVTVFYTIMPYHIMYSMTMWKDVMFGGCVLLFVCFNWKILKGITQTGSRRVLLVVPVIIGAFGMCLFRNNGFIAFVISFVIMVILYRKDLDIRIYIVYAAVIIISWVLLNPVLDHLGVSEHDPVDGLSIPLQQIARVIDECEDLTPQQLDMLNKVIDVDKVTDNHWGLVSDSLKNLVIEKGNQSYLEEHKTDYLKLYLEIGIAHPKQYLLAWVDQTSGYWNGGNDYWKWTGACVPTEYGPERINNSEIAEALVNAYCWYYDHIGVLKLFVSIGFNTWILLGMVYIGFYKKNREIIVSAVPVLAIIFTLLLATPVYSEFRYIYSMFCCLPFLAFAALEA